MRHIPRNKASVPARVLAALAALAVAGCDLTVPDLNSPASLDDLQNNPTRSAVAAAATGLLVGARANWGSQNGPVAILGILGREGYNFDAADPRFVTSLLIGPLSGGEPAFGGNLWGNPYGNIRNAHILLGAVQVIGTDPGSGLTPTEKEAVRGFAKTIMALEFLLVAVTRDSAGAPITVDIDPRGDPAPIATRADVYNRIVGLLDSAQTHLAAGGAAFPFPLSTGFAGFTTPATFTTLNRAIRARVAAYLGDWNGVLTALAGSFIDTTASLGLGAYHSFGTGSGDVLNGLFDPDARALHAHPSFETDAQTQPGGAKDRRFLEKTDSISPAHTVQNITTHLMPTVYNSPTAAVPIIRNEELILLRAEANIQLNNLATALTDINTIRVKAGGLAPLGAFADQAAAIDELLYNRRYSLFWEGGHRWIDVRRYNRLALLPQDLGTHRRFQRLPFPINECTPRDPQPSGCTDLPGF
jgi:hypothetical protein